MQPNPASNSSQPGYPCANDPFLRFVLGASLALAMLCVGACARHAAFLADTEANAARRSAAARTLFVSPHGNDSWTGDLPDPEAGGPRGPLASLAGARDRVRAIRSVEPRITPIHVLFRGGTYQIEEPVVFTPEDSAPWHGSVTYDAYPGDAYPGDGHPKEKPVFSGARTIANWRHEGRFWVADLPDVRSGKWYFMSLWVNGERRTPARTPNEGRFYTTAGKIGPVTDPATSRTLDLNNVALIYKNKEIKRWKNLEDALVVVFHAWNTTEHRIAKLDEERSVVVFTNPLTWNFHLWGEPRYYVSHIFEGLDQPGEWYLDRNEGKLYYLPMPGEKLRGFRAVASATRQMIRFEGDPPAEEFIENLHFRNLAFEYADYVISRDGHADGQAAYSVEGLIQARGIRDCSFEQCAIAHTGTYAIGLADGCLRNQIRQNAMTDLGAGGVRIGIGEPWSSSTLATGHNLVDNNIIRDGGRIFRSGVGIWVGRSSYNVLSHNDISRLAYSAISVGWSWGYDPPSAHHNIIESNHIHQIGEGGLSDMGGIYLLGQAPGTIIRNNLIHDITSHAYGGWGIYHDEGSTDLLVENNIVFNCKHGAFTQHYGRANRVRNNIFAFSGEGGEIVRGREEPHFSFFFEGNIVYSRKGPLLGDKWEDDGFYMDRNCYWIEDEAARKDFANRSLAQWRAAGHDRNSIIANPLFVNPARGDFRLKRHSPAITQLGFRPIETNDIGLYGPRRWANHARCTAH